MNKLNLKWTLLTKLDTFQLIKNPITKFEHCVQNFFKQFLHEVWKLLPNFSIELKNQQNSSQKCLGLFQHLFIVSEFLHCFLNVILQFLQNIIIPKWRKFASNKNEFWSAVCVNKTRHQLFGLNRLNNLQVVTCKFPKVYKCFVIIYKWNLPVHLSVHINVLCLTVISTVNF